MAREKQNPKPNKNNNKNIVIVGDIYNEAKSCNFEN